MEYIKTTCTSVVDFVKSKATIASEYVSLESAKTYVGETYIFAKEKVSVSVEAVKAKTIIAIDYAKENKKITCAAIATILSPIWMPIAFVVTSLTALIGAIASPLWFPVVLAGGCFKIYSNYRVGENKIQILANFVLTFFSNHNIFCLSIIYQSTRLRRLKLTTHHLMKVVESDPCTCPCNDT